ncbi:MAG: hypothetical protein IJR55_02890 [Clostridia bacterium]|nr:hypothetical protein [Clostridia bacterium]
MSLRKIATNYKNISKDNIIHVQDNYLEEVEQTYSIAWLKRKRACFEQEWECVKTELNATFNSRGKNVALECLQFGGNLHFIWGRH